MSLMGSGTVKIDRIRIYREESNNIQYMYSHNINATAFSELIIIHYINYNNIKCIIQNAKHFKLDR